MQIHRAISEWIVQKKGWRWLALLGFLSVALYLLAARGQPADPGVTFVARRGALDITVLEGGSIESEEKGEIKCEVKGGQGVKILKIVEEGYQVTEEDVRTNLVLVELDSAELKDRITQQEITFESTVASLTEAQQAYEIQLNQNLSDIMAAIQKARFARMDFEKYMGDAAANEIIAKLGLVTDLDAGLPLQSNETSSSLVDTPPPAAASSPLIPVTDLDSASSVSTSAAVDFARYADIAALGDGEAKQKLREFQDTLQVSLKEQQQAQATLEGTQRLFTKNFVTRTDLDRDQLAFENNALKVKKAQTALSLFEKYEFPKAAEENLSKYTEALRELDRTRKGALSRMAQASAKLKSAQARHSLEESQLKELHGQLEKCTILAPRPGLVVYGDGSETRYWRGEEQIREGAVVREQQTVITVPDMSRICIKVKIHESYIKKIRKGQKATITVDAFADRSLDGEVSQVAVLPDSENAWLNPDMKVYRTTVTINGEHDWIRPGMSAKVQIQVDQLPDVVYIPLQAVTTLKTRKVCYVLRNTALEMHEVQIGQFNDEFIEIKDGIAEGDRVSLRAPPESDGGPAVEGEQAPATPPVVAAM